MMATPGSGRGGEDPVRFVKNLFLEDRDFPVETALQLVKENCDRILNLMEIGQIRTSVLASISRAVPVDSPPAVVSRPNGFANHPRLVIAKKPLAGGSTMSRAQVDVAEKRQWLDEYLKTQPRIPTIKEAQAALKKQFGEALGTTFVANKLTEYRNKVFMERRRQMDLEASQRPVATVPTEVAPLHSLRETVKSIANLMRVNGIKKISVDDEGKIDFESTLAS